VLIVSATAIAATAAAVSSNFDKVSPFERNSGPQVFVFFSTSELGLRERRSGRNSKRSSV
jgi:hypothetical protein